ncbi:Oxidoreductase probably involved in sulfite reduction [Candidatus Paraburkholderia kirkii]|nr:Oxidoreductase probably involved in sulfite reduction [Candidatus Paraburkholderia kirkii]
MRILTQQDQHAEANQHVARLANDDDPLSLGDRLATLSRIELHFPHFTDGRAYSQAYLLRRRMGFKGDLRATGDVLIDQLVQMERTGFSSAVLKERVDAADAERQFARFPRFYQDDLTSR